MAVVAVTDHVFPDLNQERTRLDKEGHGLRFDETPQRLRR
jgi:hypothetical protein